MEISDFVQVNHKPCAKKFDDIYGPIQPSFISQCEPTQITHFKLVVYKQYLQQWSTPKPVHC